MLNREKMKMKYVILVKEQNIIWDTIVSLFRVKNHQTKIHMIAHK